MNAHFLKRCLGFMLVLCIYASTNLVRAQSSFTLNPEKFEWYAKKNNQASFFVHFDKNVYAPGEQVWFAGYVLNGQLNNQQFHSVSILLIKDAERKTCLQQEFAMQYGLSNGSLTLPDTLLPGAYHLMVFGSKLKQMEPECIFIQPITIKPNSNPDLLLLLKNTSQNVTDSIKVQVKLLTKGAQSIPSHPIVYHSINPLQKNAIKGMIKTNAQGEALISVPTKMLTKDNSLLKISVKKGFDYVESFFQLPVYSEKFFVKFYPESGNIIDGLPCNMGVEIRDAAGAPLATRALLYENQDVIGNVNCGKNGLGNILFTPNKAHAYTLKLINDTTPFLLPPIAQDGYFLQLKRALVNDTLDVTIQGTKLNALVSVVFHNYKEIFGKLDFVLKKATKKIKFPIADLPKGLFAITLLDSAGNACAERLAFAHSEKRIQVKLQTPEKVTTRGKIVFKVQITNQDNIPQKGIFSFACVQDNRSDSRKFSDIENHFYISERVKDFALGANYLDSTQSGLLEQLLLTKTWKKYTWNDLISTQPKDTLAQENHIQFTATIKKTPDNAKPPFKLQLLKDEGFEIVEATNHDATAFSIHPPHLYTSGKQIFLTAQNAKNDQVPFLINNPYPKIGAQLVNSLQFPMLDFSFSNFKRQPTTNVDLNESVKMLEEVVVTTTVRCMRPSMRNECGDYVCKTNMLNCPVHLTCGTPALNGNKYYTAVAGRIENLIYRCDGVNKVSGANVQTLKGIALPKKFYEVNYASDGKDDQIFQTTLYWNPTIITNDKGEAEITFQASDLTGRFKCVINGQTANDYFSAQKSITVIAQNPN